uniref:Golgi apparatus membrane protein TVP23 homolog n=1 Tax=Arcella intermedia TaxID=1963864 RepID=A0A6B2LJN2_9EUKA
MQEEGNAFFGNQTEVLEPLQVETPPTQPVTHYKTVIAHLIFKVAALVTFLLGDFVFEQNFVVAFIVTVIFVAVDFWITKNVSGRLLVGLRWWNEVKPDGQNEWIFESIENKTILHPIQTKIFWVSLFVFPAIWLIILISQILGIRYKWAILCGLACALSGANVTGYVKCAKDARKKARDMAKNFIFKAAVTQL